MKDLLISHLRVIEHLMNHDQFDDALKILLDLAQDHPKSYRVSSLLGECYLSIGQPDRAIKALKWAMKKYNERRRPKKREKRFVEENDFVDELKKSFRRHLENIWIDHYLIGCAYGRTLRFPTAIRHLNIANRLCPNNSEVIRNIGWIRCLQEKKDEGRALLGKAIELDPQNALAYNDLGASFMFEENFPEAKKWIDQAVTIDPEDDFILDTAEKLEELMAYKTLFR